MLDTIELKFILNLVNKPNYLSPISQIKPNSKTKASERDKICRQLQEKQLVDYTSQRHTIKLTAAGKSLLKLAKGEHLLTDKELKIIQGCQDGAITPSQIKISPASQRDEAINSLIEKGFLEEASNKIKEVWLTEKGKTYLAQDFTPTGGGNVTLSKKMLGDYIQFLRQFVKPSPSKKWTDEEILELIKELDQELGTDNFLPIYYLREKVQPPLSRNDLDQALYRLEKQRLLEMSKLSEDPKYPRQQVSAGIKTPGGKILFFLTTY